MTREFRIAFKLHGNHVYDNITHILTLIVEILRKDITLTVAEPVLKSKLFVH